jgi:uracil-DNA glycosylase
MADAQVRIHESWQCVLKDEFEAPYFTDLRTHLRSAYREGQPIFPPAPLVFNAFNHCPLDRVKVVILGQDPYHSKGQAHGLSFSVPGGVRIPPSLKNIYKEIQSDLGTVSPESGDLTRWADQGVLLLNATLTVLEGRAGSHQGLGWERFTDAVIQKVSDMQEHVVFLLWGKYAQSKRSFIDTEKHCVLEAPHPSPLSAHAGFFGCRHFSKTNEYLIAHGKTPIVW